MSKILLIINTIIHLKPIQIRYQIWYRLRRICRNAIGFKYPLFIQKEVHPLRFTPWIDKPTSFENYTFTFLNISNFYSPPLGGESEGGNINWNDSMHGKLWTYNLNYFDFLLQPEMKFETGLKIISDFISKLKNNPTALEPYPIALRGINWIKFLSNHRHCEDDEGGLSNLIRINGCLYAQYQILLDNIEYHLLANHLLEDGFSLLFGAFYFNDEKLYKKAKEIIGTELEEQIFDDGGHFELSPMYHQIILDRLLDCINLVQNNKRFETQDSLLDLMRQQVQKMLDWLNTITFFNGEIPLLNDSAPNIAPSTAQLKKYASSLNLQPVTLSEVEGRNPQLSSSGYRKFTGTNYECIIDVGQIGPSYQPGHAHADTFNFVLNINNKPFIVDSGISTYNANETRLKERGTAAHNTVSIQDKNSSEIWSSFRVAQRAKVKILNDSVSSIVAEHNGYIFLDTIHNRKWYFNHETIEITDTLIGKNKEGIANFWITNQNYNILNSNQIQFNNCNLTFTNADQFELKEQLIPDGFNQFKKALNIKIKFKDNLVTKLQPTI